MDTSAKVREHEVMETSFSTIASASSIKDDSTLLSESSGVRYAASADGRIDMDLPSANQVNLSKLSLSIDLGDEGNFTDSQYGELVQSLEEDLHQIFDEPEQKRVGKRHKSSVRKRMLNRMKQYNPFTGKSKKDQKAESAIPQIVISPCGHMGNNTNSDTEVILDRGMSGFSEDIEYELVNDSLLSLNISERVYEERLDAVEEYLKTAYKALSAALRVEKLRSNGENVLELLDAEEKLELEIDRLRFHQEQDYNSVCMDLLSYYANSAQDHEVARPRVQNLKSLLLDIARLREDPAFGSAISGLKVIQTNINYIYQEGYFDALMSGLTQASQASQGTSSTIHSRFIVGNISGLTDIPATLYDAYSNYSDLTHLKGLYKEAKVYLKQEGIEDKDLEQILKLIKRQHDFGGKKYKIFVDLLKITSILGGGALAIFVLLVELELIVLPAALPFPPIAAGIGVGVAGIGVAGLVGYLSYKGGRKIYKYYKQKEWQHIAQHKGNHYKKLRKKYSVREIDAMAHAKLARHDPYYSMLILHNRLAYQGSNPSRVRAKENTEAFLRIFGFNDELLNDISHVERNTAAFLLANKLGFSKAIAQL